MIYKKTYLIVLSLVTVIALAQCNKNDSHGHGPADPSLIAEGKNIFRFDTFGDEDFWSGLLHIDKAIAGADNGGFGPGVSPKTALAVGLKVDAEALPASIVTGIQSGAVDLNDPATTLALLKLNAVVGVKGNFNAEGALKSIGITCASCHSTVDDSFAPGIGKRLDGWPNRDLSVGAVISLTDNAKPVADMLHVDEATLRSVLGMWGPGKFAAILFMDGKALRPDGKVAANLLPAAFGLKGINLTTYTGWGDIKYWNSFVANLEMHGKGNFSDPRLNDPVKYPIAAENNLGNTTNSPDLITSKLPAQGSSTVAIITAASLVTPLLTDLGLQSPTGITLAILSMGAGSMVVSHANDAYFWVISRFSNLETAATLKVYSLATLLMGLTVQVIIWIVSMIS